MVSKRITLSLLLVMLCNLINAQLQNAFWPFYSGNSWGLSFTTTPASTLNAVPGVFSSKPNSSICDINGNLLFYAVENTIYDRTFNVMQGLTLPNSLSQPLIVPKPGSTNLFYIFHKSGIPNNLLHYSIVDINLAAGNGSVIVAGTLLNAIPINTNEFIVTKHCNGTDLWLVTRGYDITSSVPSTVFFSYLITSAGISTTAINTSTLGTPANNLSVGTLKFSSNGKRLGRGTHVGFEVYDFDISTGAVTNSIALGMGNSNTGAAEWVEFSPDGSKMYGAKYTKDELYQWDLCAGTASQIINSMYTYTVTGAAPGPFAESMALAPDGKIYYLSHNDFISCIANPNLAGVASLHTQSAIATPIVNNNRSYMPRFSNSFYYQNPIPTNFTYSSIPTSCQTYSFNSAFGIGSYVTGCTASSYSVTFMGWDFGDPSSGAANTSTLQSPSHFYSVPGSYTVTLYAYYQCGTAPSTLTQVINIPGPTFAISSTSITCANLGSGTITPTFSASAFTHTWLPTALTGSAVIGLAPGTYTVLSTNSMSSACIYSTNITFNPLISLSATIAATPSITCNSAFTGTGQVTNISGGSPTQNFLWSNGTQTSAIASPTNLSAGAWTVTVTDALTACQVTSVLTISQPPPLSPTLSISTPTICAGSSAILSATNSGGTPGYTYTFVSGPTNFSSTVTESISGTHVYTVQSSDANNCASNATVALNVIALPGLTVPSVSICPTTQALYTANGATSYTWLPPAANGSVTASAASTTTNIFFSDNPLVNTQYTLLGSALGCTSSTTTSVFIYASPVPIISSNSPKCEGSTALLSVSGGTGAVWSGPAIFSATTLTASVSNLSVANAGVYSTTITSVEGCTASATSSFVVNPTPTISAVGSTVCTTQTMSLFATSLVGSGYQWFGLNNFSSFLQNPTLANPTLNRTGSYTVLVTAPTSCTNTAIAQVSVTTPPSPSVVLSSNSLCAQAFNGSPNTITLTPSGASTYTLYTPNLLGSSTPIAPSASLFATTPYSSTLASGIATLQGSNGVCMNTYTFPFTVIPNPTVGINSYTPVICAGKNFTYTSNGASSYVWSATTPNFTTYSNGGVAVAHPSINAVFSVYGGSLGCNSALQSSSITVYPLPTITLSALSSSICLNDKTNLSVTGTGTTFQWLPATGLNSYTTNNVICGTQVNQVYTVIASVNNCTAAATSSVHVWSLPTAIITSTTANVCLGDNFYLSGSGGVVYNWFGPSSVNVSGQSVSIKAWSPALAGTYTLVVSDENNCKNKTTTNISILSLPEGQFKNFKDEACAPYCATYKFEGLNSKNIQSTWYINSSTITAKVFDYCFKDAGTYTLQGNLFDFTTSCKSNVSYLINVHPKPLADFSFLPKTPIENLDEVVFTNLSAGDGLLSYHWYFNDNKGFSTTSKNTSYLYAEPGDYRVALVTKNNFNCADTILKTIHVENDFALYVPNTFTPNEDNRNDVFLASVRSSKLFDLKIYDRWGAEVFHSKSPQDGWDGTYRGEQCKQDTYTWVIELSTVSGERVAKTGTVLLLR